MDRKYTLTALCRRCQMVKVGTLATDDAKAAGLTSYVDAFHVCNPCGAALSAEMVAQKAAADALLAAARAKLAKLGLTAQEIDALVGVK
jgi:hypothetical protein